MYVDRRLGGVEKYYINPPPGCDMRVPDELRKCVVFIGTTARVGRSERFVYEGTGFFVALKSERVEDASYVYLVTARHVAAAVEGNFWVRVNLTNGSAVQQDGSNDRWYRHPTDPTADVAVLGWHITKDEDHLALPIANALRDRATLAARRIGVGDEVFFTGVFALAHGRERNMPIVRKGNIAMLPEDKIPVKDFGEVDAYLIEAHSVGGISGSPVFVRESVALPIQVHPVGDEKEGERINVLTTGRFYLLGLMHGHWEIAPEDINAASFRAVQAGDLGVNLGISIVIPAGKIIETLMHPELVAERQMHDERMLSDRPLPIPDSVRRGDDVPGPEPERLAIDLPMDEAVKKMFKAGKPPRG